MKFRVGLILLLAVLCTINGYGQSWNPKLVIGFKLAEGGSVSCGLIVSYIDTSKIINPCNIAGDSCDTIVEYKWKFGNGKMSNLKNPFGDFSHITLESGVFNTTLLIKTKYGLKDSISFPIFIVGFECYFGVKVKKDTIINAGDTVVFVNNSSPDGNKWKAEWNFGDGKTFTDTLRKNAGHRYKNVGKFEVYLRFTSDIVFLGSKTTCSDFYPDTTLGEKKIIITVKKAGSIANHSPAKISIFPNPAKDFIIIEGVKKGDLIVSDLYGKEVINEDLNPNETTDISTLAKGLYFVKCSSGGFNYTGRFVKN